MPAARSPLRLVLAAAPDAPGARDVVRLARGEADAGASLVVMLTGDGLAWTDEDALAELLATPRTDVSLCSRSARARGVLLASTPPGVRWSSLVAWWRDVGDDDRLWAVFP